MEVIFLQHNNMLAFKAIALFGLIGCALAADCISGMGKRCLPKSEAGGYSIFMTGGDPCFVYSNNRVSPKLGLVKFLILSLLWCKNVTL
jgi:hypothetical protein